MFKKIFYSVVCVFIVSHVQAQTLGTYPASTITVSGNTTVIPSTLPSGTVGIRVSASDGFSGILTARPSNGKVLITNAKPAGVYTITVRAFNSSGLSTMRTFTLTVVKSVCDDGRFNTGSQITGLDPNLTSVAVADFNDDGKQDLAIAHEGFNTVSIRMGNGLGSFSGTTEITVTSHPYALAVGDFDLDGKQDFVVTNQGNNLVAVRGGDGAGGFNNFPNVNVGSNPIGIVLVDFNNDGKPDFATCNYNDHTVSIRWGNGAGSFTGTTTISAGSYPAGIAAADFNHDGNIDLATASSSGGTISIRLGNGVGAFSGTTEVPVGTNPNSVAIADFNHDGSQDLVSANYLSNDVSIRLGDGFGGFIGNTEVNTGTGPYHIAVGNFNGDENEDIATANYFDNTVSIRLGDGLGGFGGSTDVSVGSYPTCVAVGQFNNDSRQDFASTNYNDRTVSVRLGVNGLTPPLAATSNSPVCEGQSIDLTTYIGYTYSWTGPNGYTSLVQNPNISGVGMNAAGIYTVVIRNTSNCTALASTTVSILPLPTLTFSVPYDTVCNGSPVIPLTNGTPGGGVYSGQGVVPGNFFDPAFAGPGNFYLFYTYTDANGCTNQDTSKLHVLICASVNEDDAIKLELYPNPVKDEFSLQLPFPFKDCNIKLFTLEGVQLAEWKVTGSELPVFSTNGIAKGIYLIRIEIAGRAYVSRFMKAD